MKKKNSYRWLIWILLAVILIGVALWNILPPYLDRMKSEQDYQIDHQDELGINYPIVYSGDNEKYLRKDIHGNEHIAGSIFLANNRLFLLVYLFLVFKTAHFFR